MQKNKYGKSQKKSKYDLLVKLLLMRSIRKKVKNRARSA